MPRNGGIRDEATWRRIHRLYTEQDVKVSQLAIRFGMTKRGIRYVLRQMGKPAKCGASASTN